MLSRHKEFTTWVKNKPYNPKHTNYLYYITAVSQQDITTFYMIINELKDMMNTMYIFHNHQNTDIHTRTLAICHILCDMVTAIEDTIERNHEEREERIRSRWEYKNGY